jgi:hypothetical protein
MQWTGKIRFDEKHSDSVKRICGDIELKDNTFKWNIDKNVLMLEGGNRNLIYRRVVWMINKVDYLKGCRFVVEKNAECEA